MREDSKRIARNTVMLYMRTIFSMVISLYTSRLFLEILGIEDFGIYNVVGGVVSMFSLISGSLSNSIGRFLTVEIGKDNNTKIQKVFSTSVNIQLIIAIIIFICVEIGGIWFINNKMTIPIYRLSAAKWALHCSAISFVINLLSIPYNSLIIAHEHMKTFAYIGILENILKLSILLVLYNSDLDSLKLYAVLSLLVSLLQRGIYYSYCRSNFKESKYKFIFDKSLFKSMFSFAGWNTIGNSAFLMKEQGVNVAINIFLGPSINAARAIASQVNNAVSSFVGNFTMALNPQITKSYTAKDLEYTAILVEKGSKLSFFLLLLISLPILLETQYILEIWLTNVPTHAIRLVQIILVCSMSDSISNTIITLQSATGKIRDYQIVVGGILLLNFPLSYFFLSNGYSVDITLYISLILSQLSFFARLYMIKRYANIDTWSFFRNVYCRVVPTALFSSLTPLLIRSHLNPGIERFILTSFVALGSTLTCIFLIGCNRTEKSFITKKIKSIYIQLLQLC